MFRWTTLNPSLWSEVDVWMFLVGCSSWTPFEMLQNDRVSNDLCWRHPAHYLLMEEVSLPNCENGGACPALHRVDWFLVVSLRAMAKSYLQANHGWRMMQTAAWSLVSMAKGCSGHRVCLASSETRANWATSHRLSVGYEILKSFSCFVVSTIWSKGRSRVLCVSLYFGLDDQVVSSSLTNHGCRCATDYVEVVSGKVVIREEIFLVSLSFPVCRSLFCSFTLVSMGRDLYTGYI